MYATIEVANGINILILLSYNNKAAIATTYESAAIAHNIILGIEKPDDDNIESFPDKESFWKAWLSEASDSYGVDVKILYRV